MTKYFLLFLSAISLALAGGANTFRVDLYQPTVINGTTLKPGEAKVEIQDGKVVFHQGKTTAEAPVKVETNKNKYSVTTVGYKDGESHQIKDICVSGTTTHIVFEAPAPGAIPTGDHQ
jgi:hypothetical protein